MMEVMQVTGTTGWNGPPNKRPRVQTGRKDKYGVNPQYNTPSKDFSRQLDPRFRHGYQCNNWGGYNGGLPGTQGPIRWDTHSYPTPANWKPSLNSTLIYIDGNLKDLVFYDDACIVFLTHTDPREISFKTGSRRIIFDDKESTLLSFNEPYRDISYNGNVHKVRLGAPTREIYIDGHFYSCEFGSPGITVQLFGKAVNIKLEGPIPRINIGKNIRTDIVVGKVDFIIDNNTIIPIFLDGRTQKFDWNWKIHTLKFIYGFWTVLIDNSPFNVQFGGPPKPFFIDNEIRFIRFTALPRGVKPGCVKIRNMVCGGYYTADAYNQKRVLPNIDSNSPNSTVEQLGNFSGNTQLLNNTDINNENNVSAPSSSSTPSITNLYQRLVDAGFVSPTIQEMPKLIDFSNPSTLKKRHYSVIKALHTGQQCSSCDMRFHFKNTTLYHQHLDWHFNQNHKAKSKMNKLRQLSSRGWNYSVTDWKNYTINEDLNRKEKSRFEVVKKEHNVKLNEKNDTPSLPARNNVPVPRCELCNEIFEEYYNEEMEEWQIRNAVKTADNLMIHPSCKE